MSHQGQSMINRRGTLRWCNSDTLRWCILNRNGTCHFSLIGRYLESVSRTEQVFELNLAPSEERLTYEFLSDSGIFYRVIVLTSQVATFVPGQRSKVT